MVSKLTQRVSPSNAAWLLTVQDKAFTRGKGPQLYGISRVLSTIPLRTRIHAGACDTRGNVRLWYKTRVLTIEIRSKLFWVRRKGGLTRRR